MELELSKSYDDFKNFVGLLKAVCEEATLQVSPEGIHVLQMDPSHVAMIDVLAKPGLFDSFNAPTAEKITINLTELWKFLERMSKDERIKISLDRQEMKLKMQATKGKYRRSFSMSILETIEEEAPEPKIFFKAHARILTENFRKALKDALLVSEHVKFKYTADAYAISAAGDLGNTESYWERGSDDLLDLKVEEEATATFTLSYLDDIIGALKFVAEVIEVNLSMEMPCKIVGTGTNVDATYYLAPCIGI